MSKFLINRAADAAASSNGEQRAHFARHRRRVRKNESVRRAGFVGANAIGADECGHFVRELRRHPRVVGAIEKANEAAAFERLLGLRLDAVNDVELVGRHKCDVSHDEAVEKFGRRLVDCRRWPRPNKKANEKSLQLNRHPASAPHQNARQ